MAYHHISQIDSTLISFFNHIEHDYKIKIKIKIKFKFKFKNQNQSIKFNFNLKTTVFIIFNIKQ